MYFSEDKLIRLNSMMTDFSTKHGFTMRSDTNTREAVTHYVFTDLMRNRKREYDVIWKDIRNLSEAASSVFADMIAHYQLEGHVSNRFKIKKVIFNYPATIVLWEDGTKTVVKTQNGEYYDCEKGLAMCFAKKALGNEGNYYNTFMKYSDGLVESCGVTQAICEEFYERREKAELAYNRLMSCFECKRVTKDVMRAAMEEAVGYLGEVLDD